MCKIDLQDAYFLVPIAKQHKKYLRFEFNGSIYEYNCMPFGLNVAPFVFTKLMKPIITALRARGFRSVIYLDDILLLGRTYNEAHINTVSTLRLFISLGFVPNYKKSVLIPVQKIQYLGFVYDSTDMTISIPQGKIKNILNLSKILGYKKVLH